MLWSLAVSAGVAAAAGASRLLHPRRHATVATAHGTAELNTSTSSHKLHRTSAETTGSSSGGSSSSLHDGQLLLIMHGERFVTARCAGRGRAAVSLSDEMVGDNSSVFVARRLAHGSIHLVPIWWVPCTHFKLGKTARGLTWHNRTHYQGAHFFTPCMCKKKHAS